MSTFKLTTTELAERLSVSFQNNLEVEIGNELRKKAEPIIKDMAKEIAERLKVHIVGYESSFDRTVNVAIVIDGVKDLSP